MCASLFGGRSDPVSFFAGVYVQTAKKSSVCCAESKVWGEYYNSVKNYSVMAASISSSEYFCTSVFGSNHPLISCCWRNHVSICCATLWESETICSSRVWRRPDPNNVRRFVFSKNNSFSVSDQIVSSFAHPTHLVGSQVRFVGWKPMEYQAFPRCRHQRSQPRGIPRSQCTVPIAAARHRGVRLLFHRRLPRGKRGLWWCPHHKPQCGPDENHQRGYWDVPGLVVNSQIKSVLAAGQLRDASNSLQFFLMDSATKLCAIHLISWCAKYWCLTRYCVPIKHELN